MSDKDYSFWSRLLHRMALGNRFAAEMSFDIEKLMSPQDDRDVTDEPHVFVAGLARAGTTILMRELYATGCYRSLTYRDMPFPLAPNLWARTSQKSRVWKDAEERAHGDGILVDFDSPEAFEDVFWRVRCGAEYIKEDRLVPMEADPDVVADFKDYVSLLLRSHPERRYLSKNNNNILRLGTLVRSLPNAVVIVPFREPAQHARSLLRQHRLFVDRHGADAFSRNYMTWLVHHEFGQDHRPFVFDDTGFSDLERHDPNSDVDYWLTLWMSTYRYLLNTAPANCVFLAYERLCNDTGTVWPLLCDRLNLPAGPVPDSLTESKHAEPDKASELSQDANALYTALCDRGL